MSYFHYLLLQAHQSALILEGDFNNYRGWFSWLPGNQAKGYYTFAATHKKPTEVYAKVNEYVDRYIPRS